MLGVNWCMPPKRINGRVAGLDPSLVAEASRLAAELPSENIPSPAPVEGSGRRIEPAAWEAYLESLRNGARFSKAAKAAGFSYTSVANRRKVDPDFVLAEREAEAQACEVIEDALWAVAVKGNTTAILHWLGNRGNGRWSDTRRPDRQVLQLDVAGRVELDSGAAMASIFGLMDALSKRAQARGELAEGVVIDIPMSETSETPQTS